MSKLLLIIILINLCSSLLAVEKLEGFREYKFGMTIQEADALSEDDTLRTFMPKNIGEFPFNTHSPYSNYVLLLSDQIIWGGSFKTLMVFDQNDKLKIIHLTSPYVENKTDDLVLQTVIKSNIIKKYGYEFELVESKSVWSDCYGNFIIINRFRTTDDLYFITVIIFNGKGL